MKFREGFIESLKNVEHGPYGIVIERGGIVRKIRRMIYRLGFRPKVGSIFCSPSLGVFYANTDSLKAELDYLKKEKR